MLVDFFLYLKEHRVPVTITEYLALLEALQSGLANCSLDDFYALARICLVKNEAHYDRFDQAFAGYFNRIRVRGKNGDEIPADWVHDTVQNLLSAEELAHLDITAIEKPPMLDQPPLEASPPDSNGSKTIGSDRKGMLGMGGVNPTGIPMDGVKIASQKAVKAWDSREFKGLDDEVELGTRNMKVALRRLRKFAREGVPDELDLEETIRSTAKNAGWLDLVMRPERKNKVKVLLFFDTGGSMTPHVKICEELFSAASSEFKHMDHFYFHNCVYDTVWKYDGPSFTTHYPIHYITNKFGKDYKLIFVGDATMGPTEISEPLNNTYQQTHSRYSGETWLRSLLLHFRHAVWLNPEEERFWNITRSIEMIRDIMDGRMFPLTLRGLDDAMRALSK